MKRTLNHQVAVLLSLLSPLSVANSVAQQSPVPLVALDASALTLGSIATWTHSGSLAEKDFTAFGNPMVTTIAGVKGVTFDGDDYFEGPTTVPGIEGSSNRTVTAWVYNPFITTEEPVISWGKEGAPNGNMPFNHSTGATWGALNFFGSGLGWANQQEAGVWTFIAYTQDGPVARVYTNGKLSASLTTTLITSGGLRMLLGAQRRNDGVAATNPWRSSLSIAKLKVYDQAISGDGIKRLFSEDGPVFGRSVPFTDWIAEFPRVGSRNQMNEDPDSDGISSGLENFFGTPPDVPSGSLTSTAMGRTSTFTHPRNPNPVEDLTAVYLWSKNMVKYHLGGETDPDGTRVDFSVQPDTPAAGTTTVTATASGTAADRLFFQSRLTQTPETFSQLQHLYAANGGRSAFPRPLVRPLEAFLFAEDEIETGLHGAARKRLDELFVEMPMSDNIWRAAVGFNGLQFGNNPSLYGTMRMINQILASGDPSGARTMRMTAVVVPRSVVTRPIIPGLAPETVNEDIDAKLLANDFHVLRNCSKLFRRWYRAISGGVNVELLVHVVAGSTTVDFNGSTDEVSPSYTQIRDLIATVPFDVANGTDFWWFIYPSGVPNGSTNYGRNAGGIFTTASGPPTLVSNDAWFLDKPASLGQGPYSEIEQRLYFPLWFMHEFMHDVFQKFPQFGLEAESHQWFDRSKWPADFVGQFEADYYHEALNKRIFSAQPSLANAYNTPSQADMSTLDRQKLVGDYERRPILNAWHEVSIRLANNQLRWQNKAGVSWSLEVRGKELWWGADSPYGAQRIAVFINDNSGQVIELRQGGEVFYRVGG